MASVNQNRAAATKRLMKDLKELRESPAQNVSATPLEDNMFEWHCSMAVDNTVLHVVLYFPDNYPHIGPAADFFPRGLRNPSGASRDGKKGSSFCMSLLSNYNEYHSEWKTDEGYGWSPAYTVQSLLLNIAAAMTEYNVTGSENNSKLLTDNSLSCADCGHTCESPFPPLPELSQQTSLLADDKDAAVTCYISRQAFDPTQRPETNTDLFGFGLDWHGPQSHPYWSSPCEPLTYGSFQRMKDSGLGQSSTKEEIKFFLPLYLSPNYGESIIELFEDSVKSMVSTRKGILRTQTFEDMPNFVLESLPNLMATTIEDFSNALEGSASLLSGFFAFHRLFIWAIDTYAGLQELIEEKIQLFLSSDSNRNKRKCVCPEEWLMLLSVSKKYRWEDVAAVYITEVWHREIIETLKGDTTLGKSSLESSEALDATCKLMATLNKRLALQMQFINVANPAGMTREDVIRRYDDNLGFPTCGMEKEIRNGLELARSAKTFSDWFKIWKAEVQTDDEIRSILLDAVHFSLVTPGYQRRASKLCKWKQVLKSAFKGEKKLEIKPSRHSDKPTSGTLQIAASVSTNPLPSANISTIGGAVNNVPPRVPNSRIPNCDSQETQPMDRIDTVNSDHSAARSHVNLPEVNFLQRVEDEDTHTRPQLRPEMTSNCLEQLKAKRRFEILRSSVVNCRPRRIRSCSQF